MGILMMTGIELVCAVKAHPVHEFPVERVVESIVDVIARLLVLATFPDDAHQE